MANGDDWSEAELEAAVEAYLKMLSWEQTGVPFSKSAINTELRAGPLSTRSKGSVEYRMQNISSTLHELCLPWINGYKPAGNVGVNVKDRLRTILKRQGVVEVELAAPTANNSELVRRTADLRKRLGKKVTEGVPRGQMTPKQVTSTTTQFSRDPLVRAWVLEVSDGMCEACGSAAPFIGGDGAPFLEVHHVTPLADGGPDVIENTIAVCPNCHRRLHLSQDRQTYRENVLAKVKRLGKF